MSSSFSDNITEEEGVVWKSLVLHLTKLRSTLEGSRNHSANMKLQAQICAQEFAKLPSPSSTTSTAYNGFITHGTNLMNLISTHPAVLSVKGMSDFDAMLDMLITYATKAAASSSSSSSGAPP